MKPIQEFIFGKIRRSWFVFVIEMTFTDDDLKRLKEHLGGHACGGHWECVHGSHVDQVALLARLEAIETFADEASGHEFVKHCLTCQLNLEAWRKSKGEKAAGK